MKENTNINLKLTIAVTDICASSKPDDSILNTTGAVGCLRFPISLGRNYQRCNVYELDLIPIGSKSFHRMRNAFFVFFHEKNNESFTSRKP